jgi:hypothetical protein
VPPPLRKSGECSSINIPPNKSVKVTLNVREMSEEDTEGKNKWREILSGFA